MRVAGLFAGIGGLELGLSRGGHEAICFSEVSTSACAVLADRFPDVPNVGSITDLDELPTEAELVTAGFPCQDLSQAGRTAGITGDRSGLVDHVFRLLDRRRVGSVLIENVSFMLQLDGGRAMTHLVEQLERRGYAWAYRVVNSLGFLPQRRERVYLLASRVLDPAAVLLVDDVDAPRTDTTLDANAHGFYWTEGVRGLGWAAEAIPTLKVGSTVGIPAPPAILFPEGLVATPDIRDAERLQGFPPDWTLAAERAERRSRRWTLVGNAVTVPVAAWIGQRLNSPGAYDDGRDRPFREGGRWPTAARFDGTTRSVVEIGRFPAWKARQPLSSFLEFPVSPLSARATRGFLSRTERSSLNFVPGFQDRLRRHLRRMEDVPPARGIAAE